ncbi:bifunctional diaminohydroxyphosphoribosylaminopyrimidine deaminase/5-amino-6-(5-phosphoribosylamino)uracil reductase RibD [Bacillus mangrovi]|uniref:Riboflavin biosynthesis protein RibD n=2 Tax=Metabacillus mangrovi TaxID=1491830 RepID=A0A7X2S2K9_9BACI|nr:bifunctional diaminohydroxyphosphoribosylaminopyrimidine deaminase/5-amino-6-(5-phosphoribosylamino)uracil reductase RibD [Metabacillus mangrovi]
MKLALDLASQGIGQTSPNPHVGAVVVKDGKVAGVGVHLKAGEPHAEVHAIRMAGAEAKGADVFVTLEPCSHHGRTPPCAELLVEAGIKRAVIAVLDPNPLVAGNGAERLRQAGIEVVTGLMEEEAAALNRFFFHFIQTGLPYVTLKSAATLDGKTASKTMDSKWITGESARRDVHRLRETHDAILVGVNTVLYDDPSLTCRLDHPKKQPIRIILDRSLRTPLDAKVVQDGLADTWIVTEADPEGAHASALKEKGVRLIRMGSGRSLAEVLQVLGTNGVTSILAEGGSEIHGSFIKEGCFNEMVLYLAPKLLGGRESLTVAGGPGFSLMEEATDLRFTGSEWLGSDLKLTAVRKETG